MMISDQTLTVGREGEVSLQVPRSPGTSIRVIVLDVEDPENLAIARAMARLQEQTGFVRDVLANPAEDIWNDL